MAMMCSLSKGCGEKKGLCVHEKMMLFVAVIGMAGGLGHFAFNWF